MQIQSFNLIGGVMVTLLASNLVDRGFDPQLGQTKYYTIGICCLSAKHAALKRKSKDWLGLNQHMSEWASCLSTDCCFSELSVLV
jgi:hypothetical protein